MNGIGRMIDGDGSIFEGQYFNDDLNGFGRVFWYDGYYYIGEFKDYKMHGKGKFIYACGEIQDGIWNNDEFIKRFI